MSHSAVKISAIVCQNVNRAIGYKNGLIFRLRKDMKYFKEVTSGTQNAVLMGANTYYSIPTKFFPLSDRINCIVSNSRHRCIQKDIQQRQYPNTYVFNTIEQCLQFARLRPDIRSLFVIGGQKVYEECLQKDYIDDLHLTTVNYPVRMVGDTFFPDVYHKFTKEFSSGYTETNVHCVPTEENLDRVHYSIAKYSSNHTLGTGYTPRPSEETQYLELLQDVLETGDKRNTRNSSTYSKFGLRLQFDLTTGFPLLTTKRVYWKGVVEELLWFLRGSTCSRELEKRQVGIWKKNSSRDFLDSLGLSHYREGDCGPIYGYQWRHFNAPYTGADSTYMGEGVDQLQECLQLLRTNPMSRRIFMTAWNPLQLPEMALPPCHVSYQFYVSNAGGLFCQMYQRSADLFLGLPFNIASTALLTHIVAHQTGLVPSGITVCVGDGHIYDNHRAQVKEQIQREPYEFPHLNILPDKVPDDVSNYTLCDFSLESYFSHPTLKADMVA